jgi:hypothetical protein
MEELEFEKKEVVLKSDLSINELESIQDEELNCRWTFRFEDTADSVYETYDTMVVVKSNDEVIFQSGIKSHKQTRGDSNHLRVKVQGFDSSGLRLFEWTTGTVGIYCRQKEIRQHKKNYPGAYSDIHTVSVTFLAIRYRGC